MKIKFNKDYRGILADGLVEEGAEIQLDTTKFQGVASVRAQADLAAMEACGAIEVLSGEWVDPEPAAKKLAVKKPAAKKK